MKKKLNSVTVLELIIVLGIISTLSLLLLSYLLNYQRYLIFEESTKTLKSLIQTHKNRMNNNVVVPDYTNRNQEAQNFPKLYRIKINDISSNTFKISFVIDYVSINNTYIYSDEIDSLVIKDLVVQCECNQTVVHNMSYSKDFVSLYIHYATYSQLNNPIEEMIKVGYKDDICKIILKDETINKIANIYL